MYMHATAIIADQGLRHEGHGLAIAMGYVHNHVLENLQLVRLAHQGVEAGADLALAGGRYLVMMHFHGHAHVLQGQRHGGTDVVQGVHRRYRKIATLDAWAMASVAIRIGLLGVPAGFLGVDVIEGTVDAGAPAHVIENEELGFRAEEGGVGYAAGLQIGFGALGQ